MKSTNLFRSTALVTVVAVALVGCSSGDGSGTNDPDSPTTITFANGQFNQVGRGEALLAWIEGFNTSQDGVRVEPASVPYPTFGTTILTQMGAGLGPDLIRFDMPEFASAAQSGLIQPLDDVINAESYDFWSGPDDFNFVDGKRYGVMFNIGNYALIYNTDLVQAPPATFDEFVSTAKSATRDDVYGFAYRATLPEEAGMWVDLWNFVYGFGGSYSDGNGLTLNSPDVIKGVSAFKAVYDANIIPKGADAATYRPMFGAGKVAMVIDNSGTAGVLHALEAPLAAAPIPFPVRSQGAILAPVVINGASKNQEAAATFLKWMLEPANQASLQEILGADSVATKIDRTDAQLNELPYVSTYDELTDSGRPQIVSGFEADTPAIRKIVVTQVIDALLGKQDVETAMNNAQEQALAAVGR